MPTNQIFYFLFLFYKCRVGAGRFRDWGFSNFPPNRATLQGQKERTDVWFSTTRQAKMYGSMCAGGGFLRRGGSSKSEGFSGYVSSCQGPGWAVTHTSPRGSSCGGGLAEPATSSSPGFSPLADGLLFSARHPVDGNQGNHDFLPGESRLSSWRGTISLAKAVPLFSKVRQFHLLL